MSALIADTQLRERLLFGLSLGFGGIALVLSAIGLYGTLTQAFARRRRELGVRLVLGARPETLRRMVLISAGWLIAAAIVIAVPVVLVAGGALRAFLFGVEPTDVATLIASAAFVGYRGARGRLPARAPGGRGRSGGGHPGRVAARFMTAAVASSASRALSSGGIVSGIRGPMVSGATPPA